MKKSVVVALVIAFVMSMGTVAVADMLVPGAAVKQDSSVMGVGKTMVEMGAKDRTITNSMLEETRRTVINNPSVGLNTAYQWGSSQSDNSWKAAKEVEEAQVHGLVPGDCQGDNSDQWYRQAMNQDRQGYMKEVLVPNSVCGDYHPTFK